MNRVISRAMLAVLCVLTLASAMSAQVGSYAITNAKIVTVSGSVIEKGTVVIRNGLIESVGAGVKVPADAKVLDGEGMTVYPGLIDARSTLGIPQTPPRPQGGPSAQNQQDESISKYPEGLRPEVTAASKIKAGEAQFASQRNAGFTTVLTIEDDGIFNGQSALINLAGESAAEMIVRPSWAQHVSFRTLRGGNFPTSLMGTFAALRQMFLDARRHAKILDMYEKDPKGMKRPDRDISLEALIPLLKGDQPVVFTANTEREIVRALDLAKEFGLKAYISGGQESWKLAGRLKEENVPVLLSLDFPKRTLSEHKEAEPEPLDTLRLRAEVPKNPARLKQAGVKFAFHTGELKNMREFFANAREAVANGLSEADAIRAMTLSAAEIFGVEKQTGSIEAGKIANLVVVKGDLFDEKASVSHVFVDGREFEQPKRPERPAGNAAGNTSGAPANVAGTWNLTIEPPGQTIGATLVVTQQGGMITGSLSSPLFPSTPLRDGRVTANGFGFTVTVDVGGTALDVVFDGRVTGNEVEGTVDTPQGPAVFRGTRTPR
ncbi:MAG: amidohydrolase family protein [Acidobacteriota bacterium]|nr:MAG: amidohydrolase family protein [Acidobacteriota bacterium]